MRENIPYIAEVNNPYFAEGGSDLEDLDNLKSRATNVFKNLNRAVTAEDYEWLAMEASFSVARAKCLSNVGKGGEVVVKIIPRPDADEFDLKRELYPTSELIRRVKEYLEARKLVGTKLKVEAPTYNSISVNLRAVFKKEVAEVQILKDQVEMALRRYLHPITGGPDGKGWPFGVPVAKNDVFRVLEKIDDISYIEEIDIVSDDSGIAVDKMTLDEGSLIRINKVKITERKAQF